MKQVVIGKLGLDQTLSQVSHRLKLHKNPLSDLLRQYPYLGTITIRQYLTHTSGIPQSINSAKFIAAFNINPMKTWTPHQLITIAMSHKPYFKPGAKDCGGKDCYGYSNTDYIILGIVLESITGRTVKENIDTLFSQLGLKNIYYMPEHFSTSLAIIQKNIAQAYITTKSYSYKLPAFKNEPSVKLPNGLTAKNITPIAIHDASIAAASGAIITQTPTLVKWYWSLFNGKVIPKNDFQKMLQGVPTANANKKYAFAIVITRTKKFGTIYNHDGSMYGYKTNLLYVPKLHLILAITTNTSTGSLGNLENGIIRRLLTTFSYNK